MILTIYMNQFSLQITNFFAYSFAEIREFGIKLALGKLLIFSWISKTTFLDKWSIDKPFSDFIIKSSVVNFQFVPYLKNNIANNDKHKPLPLSYQLKPFSFSEFFLRFFLHFILFKRQKSNTFAFKLTLNLKI